MSLTMFPDYDRKSIPGRESLSTTVRINIDGVYYLSKVNVDYYSTSPRDLRFEPGYVNQEDLMKRFLFLCWVTMNIKDPDNRTILKDTDQRTEEEKINQRYPMYYGGK